MKHDSLKPSVVLHGVVIGACIKSQKIEEGRKGNCRVWRGFWFKCNLNQTYSNNSRSFLLPWHFVLFCYETSSRKVMTRKFKAPFTLIIVIRSSFNGSLLRQTWACFSAQLTGLVLHRSMLAEKLVPHDITTSHLLANWNGKTCTSRARRWQQVKEIAQKEDLFQKPCLDLLDVVLLLERFFKTYKSSFPCLFWKTSRGQFSDGDLQVAWL